MNTVFVLLLICAADGTIGTGYSVYKSAETCLEQLQRTETLYKDKCKTIRVTCSKTEIEK